jgi:hypothetical protein
MTTFTNKSFRKTAIVVALSLSFVIVGCSKNGDGNSGDGNSGDVDQASGQLVNLKLDLSDSAGLLTTDSSETSRQHIENARYLGIEPNVRALRAMGRADALLKSSDKSNLKKIDSDGTVGSAVETKTGEWAPSIPIVKSIGISPNKDVYIQFEHNFVYRTTDDNGGSCSDPWSASSPCSCQLFKLKSTLTEWTSGTASSEFDNLECIDNEHRLDSWSQTGATFQFDSSSNVYYMAGFENAQGTILYKVSPTKVDSKYVKTEMVNKSICIRDWRVTDGGGLFYVGENCIDGQWSGSGAFFRYVSPSGVLVEIARNWWEYTFQPIEGVAGDQVLFFGPDPDSSSVATWDSTCLFKFDPALASGSRGTKLVSCNQHIWDWLELKRSEDIAIFGNHQRWQNPPSAWRSEYKNRCLNNSDTFIGGNSGTPVKSIVQDASGKAYIVGDISKKNAGEYSCGLEIKGNHCVINSIPVLRRNATDNYTNSTCTTDSGTWTRNGWCEGGNSQSTPSTCTGTWKDYGTWYNNIKYKIANTDNVTTYETGHVCLEVGDNSSSFAGGLTLSDDNVTAMKLKINNFDCSQPSDGWTTSYKGLAYVNPTTKMLDLKSATTEQVTEMWLIKDSLYYSSYASKYLFMKNVDNSTNTTLLTDLEVYHAGPSPKKSGWIFFDGLDFTNNSYSLGDLNPGATDVKASIEKVTGLTGRIKSMVIYGGK